MINNPATVQFWTAFLTYECDLAQDAKDKDKMWQAIPYSMSPEEHVACTDACHQLGLELKRSNKSNRSLVVSLLRRF